MSAPLAFHITIGTYGARPPGSERPHVDMAHNVYGEPLAPTDPVRAAAARVRMTHDAVAMTADQRREVQSAVADVAARYGWTVHAVAARSDHTHVVVTADRDGQALRDAIKAVASRWLNKRFGSRPWWAENGSVKYIWTADYLATATQYVEDQRDV